MTLEQIGKQLKEAREAKGLSLRQIYDRTRIPMGHLLSIDSAQIDELPEPVYVAGYIKRYADCVGLNGQTLSEEFRKDAEQAPGNGKHSHLDNAQDMFFNSREYLHKGKIDKGPPTYKTFYFNIMLAVFAIGIFWYFVKILQNNQANQIDPSLMQLGNTGAKYNIPVNPVNNQGAGAPQAPLDTAKLAQNKEAHVSLSANQHVWVEVKSEATGENLFTGFLEQGDRRDFQDANGLRVTAGNGGSLTVDYQGKIEPFGTAGSRDERVFLAPHPLNTQATEATGETKPQTPKKPSKISEKHVAVKQYRNMEDLPSRQYLPGESLGGSRSIDVPYRFNQ